MSTAGGETSELPPSEFSFSVRLGIVFVTESASLSAIAVTVLLTFIAYTALNARNGSSPWRVTHVHYYFVSLLTADLIQAIGKCGVLSAKWAADAGVTEGGYCTTQGIFKQMGDVGVALSIMSIALHTFFVLVFHWHSNAKVAQVVVTLIWIFIALVIGISMAVHKGENYYGNTGYWCWITADFRTEGIALEYIWLWLAACVNIVCYVCIALVIKGFIIVDSGKVRRRRSSDSSADSVPISRSNAIAMQMLFYPAVYLVTVSPMSIVRWMAFTGVNVPFSATCVASVLFNSSGLLNVLLFSLTRPGLVPNRGHRIDVESRRSRVVSFSHLSHPPVSYISHGEQDEWKRWHPSSLRDTISLDSLGKPPPSHLSFNTSHGHNL